MPAGAARVKARTTRRWGHGWRRDQPEETCPAPGRDATTPVPREGAWKRGAVDRPGTARPYRTQGTTRQPAALSLQSRPSRPSRQARSFRAEKSTVLPPARPPVRAQGGRCEGAGPAGSDDLSRSIVLLIEDLADPRQSIRVPGSRRGAVIPFESARITLAGPGHPPLPTVLGPEPAVISDPGKGCPAEADEGEACDLLDPGTRYFAVLRALCASQHAGPGHPVPTSEAIAHRLAECGVRLSPRAVGTTTSTTWCSGSVSVRWRAPSSGAGRRKCSSASHCGRGCRISRLETGGVGLLGVGRSEDGRRWRN